MAKPHQIEATHESHYAALRNPAQSQAIALGNESAPLVIDLPFLMVPAE
jgi:hypothetical protein